MKTVTLFIAGLLAFAVIVIGVGYLILRHINEVRKRTCGKCDFCDPSLHHCWMRGIAVDPEDKACSTLYYKRGK